MIHCFGTFSRSAGAALALLVAGTIPAAAQTTPAPMAMTMAPKPMQTMVTRPMQSPIPRLKLSDVITLRDGACWLVSDASDKEQPPEKPGPQRCIFRDVPGALTTVYVPGNRDEYITFQYTISPTGAIVGGACREGLNQGAYPCRITGTTKPGTPPGALLKVGAVIRVWEAQGAP